MERGSPELYDRVVHKRLEHGEHSLALPPQHRQRLLAAAAVHALHPGDAKRVDDVGGEPGGGGGGVKDGRGGEGGGGER